MMRIPSGKSAGFDVDKDLMVNRARNCASRGVGGEALHSVCSRLASVGAPPGALVDAVDAVSVLVMLSDGV